MIKCVVCNKDISNADYFHNKEAGFLCLDCLTKNQKEIKAMSIQNSAKRDLVAKKPYEIYSELNQVVIGQEKAKRTLSVELFNHYLRIKNMDKFKEQGIQIKKKNILLTGPTGTGKTLLAESLAKIIDVPFVIADATTLTKSGYVGSDVESILTKLIKKANNNIHEAERGIIYIDEIDKINKKNNSDNFAVDPSGEGVQQELLKLVEGYKCDVPLDSLNKGTKNYVTLDTSNILFICGGAFVGIEDIVKERLKLKERRTIGYHAALTSAVPKPMELTNIRTLISSKDLESYGMIPEFLGRFPVLANLEPLSKNDLVEILGSSNGVIAEYNNLFSFESKKFYFKDETLELVASKVIEQNLGARGLNSVITNFMTNIIFEASCEDKALYEFTKEDMEQFLLERELSCLAS